MCAFPIYIFSKGVIGIKRILVCSDIHGEIDKLENVLEMSNYDPKTDSLILLGDYIDRGNYSKEVVELVMDLVNDGAIALKGNHEDMFLKSFHYKNMFDAWMMNGGDRTLDSYNYNESLLRKHANWMNQHLKLYHETDNYIFVHAGLKPNVNLEWQEENDMLWIRHEDAIGLGKTVIHGHTPVNEVEHLHDRIFIDTGACFGGKLSLLELPSLHIYED